jgi:hypothetical protein
MENHYWGGQGWNSAVEPEEEYNKFSAVNALIFKYSF